MLLGRIDRGEDVEPESYLDVAVTKWLPRRRENPKFERALGALAVRFDQRHRDRWMRDVLASRPGEQAARGLSALSAAVEANLSDESDRALASATDAVSSLRAAGNDAGRLRAELEQTYALERALRPDECLEKAVAVERKAAAMSYSWILGQTLIEEGNCRGQSGDSGDAQRDIGRALTLVREAGYSDLELRAIGILTALQTNAGNLQAAWTMGRKALEKYSGGPYSGIRAHQIYLNLYRSSRDPGHRQAAFVFIRGAAAAIAETPRHRTEATTRAFAARLAVEAGWPEEAQAQFEQAGRLFDRLPDAKADRDYRARAELEIAEAEVAAGGAAAALRRLETIRQQAAGIDAVLVRIRFEQTLG